MATKKIKIGSLDPISIKSLTIAREQIWSSNAGRNANGTFVGTLVCTKYTLSGEFLPMTDEEMKNYLDEVEKSSFNVTFRDPKTNANKTITCYRATPKAVVYSYHDKLPRYVGTTFEFIEI